MGLPEAEMARLLETAYLLSSPANAAHLAESITQHRCGEGEEKALVDEHI